VVRGAARGSREGREGSAEGGEEGGATVGQVDAVEEGAPAPTRERPFPLLNDTNGQHLYFGTRIENTTVPLGIKQDKTEENFCVTYGNRGILHKKAMYDRLFTENLFFPGRMMGRSQEGIRYRAEAFQIISNL